MPLLKTRWRWSPAVLLVAMLTAVALLAPPGTVSPAYAQTTAGDAYAWAIGGPGADEVRQLAVDAAGNLYVAGVFSGTVDVDPGPDSTTLTSAGDTDIFLAKYDPDGRIVWAWSIGGAGADHAYQVAVDSLGNAHLAGGFTGEVDFAPDEADASVQAGNARHGFVAKYDPSGVLVWVTPLGLAGDDAVMSLALDSAGNVVAAGLSGMPTEPGQPSTGQQGDAFAMRLDADGRLAWSAVLPTRSVGSGPVAVAVSPAGEIHLAVSYTGTVRVVLGSELVDTTSAGEADVLVMKLTPAGGLVWARSIGGPGNDAPGTGGLALDADGNVLLTGAFDGLLDAAGDGAFVLDSQGQRDLFLISLDGAGAVRWAASIGGPGPDSGQRVVTDAARYVYVAGWFSGALTTDPGQDGRALVGRGQSGATDALLAKYTPDGQLAWVRGFGGRGIGPSQSSLATTALIDARGDVLLAGRFFGTDVDFDSDAGTAILSSAGQSDGFVAKFGPDGTLRRR